MSTSYGEPFKVYYVTDPATKKRSRLVDGGEAERLARELSLKYGVKLSSVLSESPNYFTMERGGAWSRRISTGCRTKLEAAAYCQARLREGRGSITKARKALEEALNEWLAELEAMGRRPETLRGYRSQTSVWVSHFAGRSVNSLTHRDLVGFFAQRRVLTTEAKAKDGKASKDAQEGKEKPKPKKPAARTLNLNLALWRSFTKWARRRGYLESDLCEGVSRWKEPRLQPRTLSVEEARLLLHVCREPYKLQIKREKFRPFETEQEFAPPQYLHAMVLAGLTTLLRLGNLRDLTWGQVDMEAGTIKIPPERSKTDVEIVVPICVSLRSALSELPKGGPDAPVFGHEVKRAFAAAVLRAKLKGVSFHTLRKSGATLALKARVDFAVVRRLGTWSPGNDVLLKHYRSVDIDELRDAVKVLDGLVTGRGDAPAKLVSDL